MHGVSKWIQNGLNTRQTSKVEKLNKSSGYTVRRLLEPGPFHGNTPLSDFSDLFKDRLGDIEVIHFAAHAAVHDLHVDALPVPTEPYLQSAEWIIIWIRACRRGVKKNVRDGADRLRFRTRVAA